MKKLLCFLAVATLMLASAMTGCSPDDPEYLRVARSAYEVPMGGMLIDIKAEASAPIEVELENTEWIRYIPSQSTSEATPILLRFDVKESEEAVARVGRITLRAGTLSETITIEQAGGEIITLPKSRFEVKSLGETITIEVRSNSTYNVIVDEASSEWITRNDTATRGIESYNVSFDIAPNTLYTERLGKVTFTGEKVSRTVWIEQAAGAFLPDPNSSYTSTDYSADGNVVVVQEATEGAGVDFVLMGDAFSDRWVASGDYDRIMREAVEQLFAEEPLKSLRHLFNVYYVVAVSEREVIDYRRKTAFGVSFGEGTAITGDNNKIDEYALKAVAYSQERFNDVAITVVVNSSTWAGTCHFRGFLSYGDWGNGRAIGYCPIIYGDPFYFGQVLRHEVSGHGFAKFDDEYVNYPGRIPVGEVQYSREYDPYGWWKNVDFTPDPETIKWSEFLADARYSSEGLGAFEGACYYSYGAYRATMDSIMRYNVGGFNAPQRQALYYRIYKLAYGNGWQYDHETFVAWDMAHRSVPVARRAATLPEKEFVPFARPVFDFQ